MNLISKYKIASLIMLILASCKIEKPVQVEDIPAEIKALDSKEKLKTYLLKIGDLDSKYRNQIQQVELKYGEQSKETRDLMNTIINTDEKNMERIAKLLEIKSYPDVDDVGTTAASVPALVLHHYYHVPTKEKYFSILQQARKDGNITETDFLFYLSGILDARLKLDINLRTDLDDAQKIKFMIDTLSLL